eukprot:2319928-Prymnesium_polylepis.1
MPPKCAYAMCQVTLSGTPLRNTVLSVLAEPVPPHGPGVLTLSRKSLGLCAGGYMRRTCAIDSGTSPVSMPWGTANTAGDSQGGVFRGGTRLPVSPVWPRVCYIGTM